jgi:hypothetical protein
MKRLEKGRMDNPWTPEEVEVDDGIWHGDNPRGRCGDVVEVDDEEVVEG